MSRAERLAKVQREIATLRSAAIRVQSEAYGFVQKLEELERQAVELAAEGPVQP